MRYLAFEVRVFLALAFVCGCGHRASDGRAGHADKPRLEGALAAVRQGRAPDPHLTVFEVGLEWNGDAWSLTGEVSSAESKTAAVEAVRALAPEVRDEIIVLPSAGLGQKTRGLVCLSVATGHELPEHRAEMGAQLLMGQSVRVLQEHRGWARVQCPDRYLVWVEKAALWRCDEQEAKKWQDSNLSIVTVFEDVVRSEASVSAEPLVDVVLGDLVAVLDSKEQWLHVELPDSRRGFLPAGSAQDFHQWKASRRATPQNIEQTARSFLGRPYLWGGNSPRGLDCSGFTELVFFMNGIELMRNAAEQAGQGSEVTLDARFSKLRKGDLLFFGWDRPGGGRENPPVGGLDFQRPGIFHVAIYLGGSLFIQSSGRVRVSSLDPKSEVYDERHARSLTMARRVLKE